MATVRQILRSYLWIILGLAILAIVLEFCGVKVSGLVR